MPAKLASEAADLAARPQFEMPYGRAWFLRLALEDRCVTGSTRLTFIARDVAASLTTQFGRQAGRSVRARILQSMLGADQSSGLCRSRSTARPGVRSCARLRRECCLRSTSLPAEARKRTGRTSWQSRRCFASWQFGPASSMSKRVLGQGRDAPEKLCKPITRPRKAHHYALNFSRGWALLALAQAGGGDDLLALALDHIETNLHQAQLVARRLSSCRPLGAPVRDFCASASDAADCGRVSRRLPLRCVQRLSARSCIFAATGCATEPLVACPSPESLLIRRVVPSHSRSNSRPTRRRSSAA